MPVTLPATAQDLPLALAQLHHELEPGTRRQVRFDDATDPLLREDVLAGGGFTVVRGLAARLTTVESFWTLPDTAGASMDVLICGLNPSPSSADSRVGFARPGNRFWPAALAAGLASVDRDPLHALTHHAVGMTDIVKRTTRRASELDRGEFADGMARLVRMAQRLEPGVVCFVGLAGWRDAVRRDAVSGRQPEGLGGRPVYLMPSTSGLNASTQLKGFVAHFRAVIELAETGLPETGLTGRSAVSDLGHVEFNG